VILFPAIDLKDGKCVRLRHGDMTQATVYNTDPAAQARDFADMGFQWLHVVDLDGAFAGEPRNANAIASICESVKIPIQLGGGIRDLARIAYWLDRGIGRVILGTAALRTPDIVKEACRLHPGRIVVGIDAKSGRAAVEGWSETSDISAVDLARRFVDSGVAAIVFTDIDRDGTMSGINLETTLALAKSVPIPVIASGGLASMAGIQRLCEPDCAILAGAISGRAIYDGRIDAAAALRLLREAHRC
jgi:phosphoribosylformimino-5-aminoimidazole carboxamide ribotide isomerase